MKFNCSKKNVFTLIGITVTWLIVFICLILFSAWMGRFYKAHNLATDVMTGFNWIFFVFQAFTIPPAVLLTFKLFQGETKPPFYSILLIFSGTAFLNQVFVIAQYM